MPQKELKEVPRCQTEDLMQEEDARGLSEEEQAKPFYCSSRRHTSKGREWMSRYIAGCFELCAQFFQNLRSSLDHVHEVE